ncbi:MAG: hypothetical protein RIR55_383 [Bacteroidota bacterium]|jgi:hypothetical protein
MDNGNFDQNDKKIESVYSTRIRAGKRRTYFFDIRATRGNDYFLTITESRKRFDNNGYDRHKIFLYKEDFNKFLKAINEAVDYVKTELMPDFDFDAFNHEGEGADATDDYGTIPTPTAAPAAPVAAVVTEPEHDIDPSTITEKKPLEARDTHASQGDNLSSEEVDKW